MDNYDKVKNIIGQLNNILSIENEINNYKELKNPEKSNKEKIKELKQKIKSNDNVLFNTKRNIKANKMELANLSNEFNNSNDICYRNNITNKIEIKQKEIKDIEHEYNTLLFMYAKENVDMLKEIEVLKISGDIEIPKQISTKKDLITMRRKELNKIVQIIYGWMNEI